MTNAELAAILAEMATLLRIEGGDPFRIRAYERAAEAAAAHGRPLSRMSPKELLSIPGIGKSMASHIGACSAGGCFPELEALRRRFPAGLREMMRLTGLGPKR